MESELDPIEKLQTITFTDKVSEEAYKDDPYVLAAQEANAFRDGINGLVVASRHLKTTTETAASQATTASQSAQTAATSAQTAAAQANTATQAASTSANAAQTASTAASQAVAQIMHVYYDHNALVGLNYPRPTEAQVAAGTPAVGTEENPITIDKDWLNTQIANYLAANPS